MPSSTTKHTQPLKYTLSMYCKAYKNIKSTCPLGGALIHENQCRHSLPLWATGCCSRAARSTDILAPHWSYPLERPLSPADTHISFLTVVCNFIYILSPFYGNNQLVFTLSTILSVILFSSVISGGFSSCLGANMDATRTTGRGTSLGTNRTELRGMVHILIFLKDLDLAE